VEGIAGSQLDRAEKPHPETAADHWILSILQQSTEKIGTDLEAYRFSEAYDTLYHTVWDDFADWYIEASKSHPNHAMLAHCLEVILTLAHPFAPFVTETIWQTMTQDDNLLMSAKLPKVAKCDQDKASDFEAVKELVIE